MKIKLQVTDISILFTIASATLYVVFRNLGREVGSFAFLWAPITLLLILLTRPDTFTKGPIKHLLIYGVIMVGILQYTLWRYMDEWNQLRVFLEFYFLLVAISILSYYRTQNAFRKLAWLSKWTFIFIIITLITTNIALYFDPFVVRQSASSADFTTFQEKVFKLSGAMGYSYVQAIVCLIPILIYHIKNKKNMVLPPKVLLAILLLLLITQIRAQVFANLLVAILITILSFLGSKNRRTAFFAISFIGIIFLAIPNSVYVNTFSSLSKYFDTGSEMYNKLNDFSIFIGQPDFDSSTEAGGRAERYPLLYNALLANPVFGHASSFSLVKIGAGGHLFWMNRLALWGIIGFSFYIFVLYKIYRSIIFLFDEGFKFYYFLSVLALILLGLTKAIGGNEPWLMLIVIIPGLYFLPLIQPVKNVKTMRKTKVNR